MINKRGYYLEKIFDLSNMSVLEANALQKYIAKEKIEVPELKLGRINCDTRSQCQTHFRSIYVFIGASQVALEVKNPTANAGDIRDSDLIPGSGMSPGEGNGNPLQYSCLENPMDRGAGRAPVHRVTQSQTRLKWLRAYACVFLSGLILFC